MATYRKRTKGWRVEIKVLGVRESATFPTKAEATAWAAQKETELRSLKGGVSLTHNVADVFDRYAKEVSVKKPGARWEKIRLTALSRMPLASVKLSDLTSREVAEWRDHRLTQVAPSTVNREMNLISHCFEIARREWRWIAASPTKDVSRPKQPPPRDRLITPDEQERVCFALGYVEGGEVETIGHRVDLAFLFAIETAMRASEICGLTHLNVNGPVAHLPKTKNGTSRNVPLSKRALELISFLPKEGASVFNLTSRQLDSNFRKYRDRAAVENLTFHDTRHEAITRLASKLEVLELARMVGHKDIKMLMIYYNETPEALADKLD